MNNESSSVALYDPTAHYRLWDVEGMSTQVKHRCWVEIDLSALQRNVTKIRASLPQGVKYISVVKADAYGHGLYASAATLMKAGIDMFAVATVYEAAEIRQLSPDFPILVLSAVLPEEEAYLVDCNLAVTVSTLEEVKRYNKLGELSRKPIAIHLKIDSGMGRLGVWHEDVQELWKEIIHSPYLHLQGVMTHFASSEKDKEWTQTQRNVFIKTIIALPGLDLKKVWVHADNSAGIDTFIENTVFNSVRIGLLQYGISPIINADVRGIEVEPVLSFYARLGIIKNLPQGTPISYGKTYVLDKDTRVGIVTAGYADGIPLPMSNKGSVLIEGKRCKILGRVAMDQMIVDLSECPHANMGNTVFLFGKDSSQGKEIHIHEFSQWADSMPWEILCSLSKRVRRVYRTPSMN